MMNLEARNPADFPVDVILYPSHDKAFRRVLEELAQKCPTQFLLLAGISGQPIASEGETGGTNLVALGALLAGDLAASQEIARQTNQYESFQLILREGRESTILLSEAGPYMILFARVDREVPLGWARMLLLEACRQLAEIAASRPDELAGLDLGLPDERLSSLIGDQLDSIWSG
jgi:predicted regulator of Ras-like GTPase activity (Roadblock/LC7/MglB family)